MRVGSGRSSRGKSLGANISEHGESGHYEAEAPVVGRWLVLGKDGRLTAYARRREGLLRWTEARPGGAQWLGPELIDVAHLTHLSVAQGDDGYVHFVGRRSVRKGDGPPNVDLVHAVQYQTGRPLTQWRSLGNPHKERDRAPQVGAPVVAVSASGAPHVFMRNAAQGLAMRRENKAGKWEAWMDLKGSQAEDAIAVSTGASGGMEVFVPGRGQAMRWVQTASDGPFAQAQSIPVQIAPGGAAALETAPGRHTFYWTDPAGAGVIAHRPGTWAIPLGGAPAEGPVTVLRATLDGYDCTVLAYRDLDGQVMLAACGTENEGAGLWWSPTGERSVVAPALTLDADGRVVVGLIGAQGALYIARQNREPGLAMAPAVRIR